MKTYEQYVHHLLQSRSALGVSTWKLPYECSLQVCEPSTPQFGHGVHLLKIIIKSYCDVITRLQTITVVFFTVLWENLNFILWMIK